MTEAAHQMASNPLPPGERRAGSVGLRDGHRDRDPRRRLAAAAGGAVGEVCVRGPGVVDGYRANPEATAASFRDGWFRTGDSGSSRADGYLSLAGRIKELINRGGEKISPHEVEDALLAPPRRRRGGRLRGARRQVRRDGRRRRRRCARRVGEDALRAHCGERLAAFKVPVRVHVAGRDPEGPDRQGAAPTAGRAAAVKIAVLGAGAIGAYVGAALARGGADVALIARGAHLAALRERRRARCSARAATSTAHAAGDRRPGRDRPGRRRLPRPQGATRTPTAGAAARAAAARARRPSSRRRTACPWWYFHRLGGPYDGRRIEAVDPGGATSAAIAPERAIGCVVYCSTELEAPGVIRHGEGTRFSLGEPDRSVSERCLQLSRGDRSRGGLKARSSPTCATRSGSSCSATSIFNPLSVLTRATLAAHLPPPGHARARARGHGRSASRSRTRSAAQPQIDDRAAHRRRRARRRAPHLDAAGSRGRQAPRARRADRRGRRARRAHGHARPDAAQRSRPRARCWPLAWVCHEQPDE